MPSGEVKAAPTREYGDIAVSRTLARVSDDLVKIPGTDFGVGIDGIIGLVPGIGDLIGTGLSSAIMVDAVRQRIPLPTLARMGFNVIVDAGLGLVPVVGDAADLAHRANRKNYRLLAKAVEADRHVDVNTRGYLLRASALVVGSILIALAIIGVVVWGIVRLLGSL